MLCEAKHTSSSEYDAVSTVTDAIATSSGYVCSEKLDSVNNFKHRVSLKRSYITFLGLHRIMKQKKICQGNFTLKYTGLVCFVAVFYR